VRATVGILASGEPRGARRAVRAIVAACRGVDARILLVAPDGETLRAGAAASGGTIRSLRDEGRGKIRALDLLFAHAEGDVLVLTDGDVVVERAAIGSLLSRFADPEIGCVSGRPVPLEARRGLFGIWAHLLFDAAHRMRSDAERDGRVVEASGYLLAVRVVPGLLSRLSGRVADDVELSHRFAAAGLRSVYEPGARVRVRNPRTLADWFRQKTRNARGHLVAGRIARRGGNSPMQSLAGEVRTALRGSLGECRAATEVACLAGLVLARGAAWSWARMTLGRTLRAGFDGWPRIDSTKEDRR